MITSVPTAEMNRVSHALPFWLSLALVPIAWIGAFYGSWTVFLLPISTWYLFSLVDAALGLEEGNPDPNSDADLSWYKAITLIWAPVQFLTLFGIMAYATRADHLAGWEVFFLMANLGVMSGTIGITYAHELMHQKNRLERWMGDILMAMAMYGHFRSEHLLVHHRYVGTPRDPVTARYNEGFHRFFPRVLKGCLLSAWKAETGLLARKDKPWWDLKNPFWRYGALQLGLLVIAFLIAGWLGVLFFIVQAFVAIWQLELVNYVEHYGLTRKHLGDGKYEHVQPRHSWNSAHKASNWLLINLQRHSDHHYKPDRRFPLLQTYEQDEAPQLPYGYPVMTMLAMIPPLWRRYMNPRVRDWRQRYYPEIEDWGPYKTASNPMPR
ncbi:alkane 1-monooxygenase [Aestuariibius sp. 2305UL40-4]|uniref:alkane 1-monooxygenase n=1 Tax=Aestuariibius violaceus TaxID=3234132 RepID=UPI00345E8D70